MQSSRCFVLWLKVPPHADTVSFVPNEADYTAHEIVLLQQSQKRTIDLH